MEKDKKELTQETEKETQTSIEGDSTSIPVKPGDQITVTLSKEEKEIIDEVRQIKAGKFRTNETEDIIDIIDNTLSLQVPAIDGTVTVINIPEDADASLLDDITLGVDEEVVADIVTLVGE